MLWAGLEPPGGGEIVTTDLCMLVAAAVLCLAIPFVAVFGLFQASNGVVWAFGA